MDTPPETRPRQYAYAMYQARLEHGLPAALEILDTVPEHLKDQARNLANLWWERRQRKVR